MIATLVDIGGAFGLDTDCVNNAGCDIAVNATAGTGKCVRYISIGPGEEVQSCRGTLTSLAARPLCASGFCFETRLPGIFNCSGSIAIPSILLVREWDRLRKRISEVCADNVVQQQFLSYISEIEGLESIVFMRDNVSLKSRSPVLGL